MPTILEYFCIFNFFQSSINTLILSQTTTKLSFKVFFFILYYFYCKFQGPQEHYCKLNLLNIIKKNMLEIAHVDVQTTLALFRRFMRGHPTTKCNLLGWRLKVIGTSDTIRWHVQIMCIGFDIDNHFFSFSLTHP